MRTTDPQARRIRAVRRELARHGLAALLVTDRANVRYLTGFTGTAGTVLVTADAITLIVDFRYFEQAAAEARHVALLHVERAFYDASVAQAVAQVGVRRVAFEADATTYAGYLGFTALMPKIEWLPSRGLVETSRLIKDAGEIAAVKRAAAITSQGVGEVMAALQPGMSEREVAALIDARFAALGAEGRAFDTLVASGPRTALPHPRPSDRLLEPGDWILLDAGAKWGGYCADMSRSFILGRPTEDQDRVLGAVEAALGAGIAAVSPGRPARDVDAACRGVLASLGMAGAFGHDTGHGVGLDLHEGPRIAPDEDEILAPGMIVTVEPGVYFPGVGGARFEELVLVTETGYEVLTTAPYAMRPSAGRA